MPESTVRHAIDFAIPGDLIKQPDIASKLAEDSKRHALSVDNALTIEGARAESAAVQRIDQTYTPRIAALEASTSTRIENLVRDSLPTNAPANYIGGRVAIVQAPGTPYGWGRAMCTESNAVSVRALSAATGGFAVAAPGDQVGASIQLRAMPDQQLSATVNVYGYKMVDGVAGSFVSLGLTSGQQTIAAGATVTFTVQGVIPAGVDINRIALTFTFRRFGETYPQVNDYLFFRRALLAIGTDNTEPVPTGYLNGNSPNSYWTGAFEESPSVTLIPKEGSSGAAANANAVLVDEWSARMGGVTNVGQKTTISVRIDHGLANFNSKLRPILETNQIPYTITLGADTWGISENAGVTPAMVNSWVAGGLCAIASHGWGNHLDTSDPDTIRSYIVDSKSRLEADIPAAAPVDIFMPPGASGAGGYGGFIPSDTPEKYYGTIAGQTALSTYPICSGQFPGTSYRVQDGKPRVGQSYFNMDTFNAAGVMTRVNTAITNGQGIQLMVHPSFIDGSGYITTAALSSVFSQIATLRTAGTVATLSVAKQYLADSRNPTRTEVSAAKTEAIADATSKYGGLPGRVTNLEGTTLLAAGTDLNTATTPGRYRSESTTNPNNPGTGMWAIDVIPSNGTSIIQVARSWNVAGRVVTRNRQGSSWTGWVTAPTTADITAAAWNKPTAIAGGTDADTVVTPGAYMASSASILNLPEVGVWAVEVLPTGSGNVIQIWNSWNVAGKQFTRVKQGGAWTGYVKTPTAADLTTTLAAAKTYTDEQIALVSEPTAAAADIGIHQHAMRLSSLRGRVGSPRLAGKGAVTLICDHGTNNFASIVLPALQGAGMRATLALNSQMYDPAYTNASAENATNWTQIKGWHDNNGIEIANHGRTHLDATGETAIRQEIEGGREELETNLPGVPIDTYVQVGLPAGGTKFDGFNDGLTREAYWETYAGRVITDSHAVYTGQVPRGNNLTRVYPLDGEPKYGASGYWLDAGQTGIDAAKARIDEAVTNGAGVIIRLHPRVINLNGQITSTQLTDFITYLQGRVTGGELEVLTYREWNLAVGW